MNRLEIRYGGVLYTRPGDDIDGLEAEVSAALAAGGGWIAANVGEGRLTPTRLLVSPGVDIAISVLRPDE